MNGDGLVELRGGCVAIFWLVGSTLALRVRYVLTRSHHIDPLQASLGRCQASPSFDVMLKFSLLKSEEALIRLPSVP